MTNDLRAAVRAFREAEASAHDSRQKLATQIFKAAQAGVKQAEICRITGYTRERIRQIVRAAEAEG